MNEKELQEIVITYQLLQRQSDELRQQALLLERKALELESSKQAIVDIEKMKDDNEILVPLGGESYTYGRISSTKRALVDVGAGIFIKKDTKSAIELIEEKKSEIAKMNKEIEEQMIRIANQMNIIALELENYQKGK